MKIIVNGKTVALETINRSELLYIAEECVKLGKGNKRYLHATKRILNSDKTKKGNIYITLKMKQTLINFILPIFKKKHIK